MRAAPKRDQLYALLVAGPHLTHDLCEALGISTGRLANLRHEVEAVYAVTIQVRRGKYAAYVLLRDRGRRCKHPGCEQAIGNGNTSGLCRRHQPQDILAALESALEADLRVPEGQGLLEVF